MKKLALGITTFNNKVFLAELLYTICSELRANHVVRQAVEVYLYDDCSTDFAVRELIQSYEDCMIVHYAAVNAGTPAAGRNWVIETAQTEYICFIDGDDTIVCSLADLVSELQQQDADLFVSDVTKVHQDGIRTGSPFLFSKRLFNPHTPQNEVRKLAVHQTGIWSIYRLSFLRKHHLNYRMDVRYEDNYFMTCIHLYNPRVVALQTKYNGWRTNYASFSNGQNAVVNRLAIFEDICLLLSEPEHFNKEITSDLFYSIWNQTYVNIVRGYPQMSKQAFRTYFNDLEKIRQSHQELYKRYVQPPQPLRLDKYSKIVQKAPWLHTFFILNIFRTLNILLKQRSKVKAMVLQLFFLFPLQEEKVFFTSHYGDFNDNAKYLYLKQREEQGAVKKRFIFAVKNPNELNAKYRTNDFIQYDNKLLFFWHHYTSKQIYFTSWYSPLIAKRSGQTWTQLWHGIPYKKVYKDIHTYEQTTDPNKTKTKETAIAKWDNVWSVNGYNSTIFRKLFPSVKVLEAEYPKVEWLLAHAQERELLGKLRKQFGFDAASEYVLYAPTYRPYTVWLDFDKVKSYLQEGQKLVIHLHPMMRYAWEGEFSTEDIVWLDKVADIQELILCTVAVITDYSSIRYDYEQLGLPVFRYQPDLNLYQQIHGLYEVT